MKWRKRGYLLAAMLALASATIQAADVTITVNGKVVAKTVHGFHHQCHGRSRRSLFFQSDVCRGGIGLA